MGLYDLLLSILDGSIFVTKSDPRPPEPPVYGSQAPCSKGPGMVLSAHPSREHLDTFDADPPEYCPPRFEAFAQLHHHLSYVDCAGSPAELLQTVRKALLEDGIPLHDQDVVDLVLKFGRTSQQKCELCYVVAENARRSGRTFHSGTLLAILHAVTESVYKLEILSVMRPVVRLSAEERTVIASEFPPGSDRLAAEQHLLNSH